MRSIAIMTQLQMKFKLLLINHTPFVYQVIHWQTNAPAISKSPEYPDCSRTSNFETFSKLFEKFIVFFNQCLKSQRWMAMHDMPPVSWDKQMLDVWYECTCWCVYTHAGKKEIVHKEEVEKKANCLNGPFCWMVGLCLDCGLTTFMMDCMQHFQHEVMCTHAHPLYAAYSMRRHAFNS